MHAKDKEDPEAICKRYGMTVEQLINHFWHNIEKHALEYSDLGGLRAKDAVPTAEKLSDSDAKMIKRLMERVRDIDDIIAIRKAKRNQDVKVKLYKLSKETREKMAEAKRGKKCSEETRKAISDSMKKFKSANNGKSKS